LAAAPLPTHSIVAEAEAGLELKARIGHQGDGAKRVIRLWKCPPSEDFRDPN
jgi:hypothetical protein